MGVGDVSVMILRRGAEKNSSSKGNKGCAERSGTEGSIGPYAEVDYDYELETDLTHALLSLSSFNFCTLKCVRN